MPLSIRSGDNRLLITDSAISTTDAVVVLAVVVVDVVRAGRALHVPFKRGLFVSGSTAKSSTDARIYLYLGGR